MPKKILLSSLVCGVVIAQPALAGGVVGSGTAASCTEAAFDAALSGGGVVTFDCGAAPVTLALTSEKQISLPTTVDGGGLITLDGGDAVRHFHVVADNVDLTVENLSLINGNGITDFGTGGAILSLGHVAQVSVNNVTFQNNHAPHGGGAIRASVNCSLSVQGSTFSGNSSPNTGAGGGAIEAQENAVIGNSTFVGNSAPNGGAVHVSDGASVNIAYSTFSGNGGHAAILSAGEGTVVSLLGNIISSSAEANCRTSSGIIVNLGNNLQFGGTVVNSCGATMATANPLLGLLAANGGLTQTMALNPGSPAIDAGESAVCPATDQRGVSRPQGARCDIGAYEASAGGAPAPEMRPVPATSIWSLAGLAGLLVFSLFRLRFSA